MTYDFVIRGGTLIDGTGAPARQADLAISGDRIAAIGRVAERGARELDAAGAWVTPGFVDIHTHLDAQLAWDPLGTSSCWHGVTSVVIGNCGFGFAPVKPADRMRSMLTMERNEAVRAATRPTCSSTKRAYDFPAGDWRLACKAEGYRTVLVNGEITFEDGVCTGATPGRLLRHGQAT